MARPRKPDFDSEQDSDFSVLMRKIPTDLFNQMVSRSGLPVVEVRELCEAFKRNKA